MANKQILFYNNIALKYLKWLIKHLSLEEVRVKRKVSVITIAKVVLISTDSAVADKVGVGI